MTVDREKAIAALEPWVESIWNAATQAPAGMPVPEASRRMLAMHGADAVLALPDREKESYEQRLARRLEDPEYRAEYERALAAIDAREAAVVPDSEARLAAVEAERDQERREAERIVWKLGQQYGEAKRRVEALEAERDRLRPVVGAAREVERGLPDQGGLLVALRSALAALDGER